MTEPRRTAIEAGLAARVAAGVRYIVSCVAPTDWFGPMQPLPPAAPPAIAGRSFDFPAGANLRIQPRQDETTSFADLRALADALDLIRLAIETRKDQIAKLDWTIRPRHAKRSGIDDPRSRSVGDFLAYPDREHDFETWLRLLLEDLLVIDAPTLYVRRDRGGALHALEVVDGATIKRVIDERGRTPAPPDVAYQQVLKGIPAIDYTTDELIYRPRNPRPHKIYGYSPVEQVAMTVNVALRRQVAQLQYYTEGNVPEAMIGVPETWSPDQIRQFQEYWDSLLEGNTAARRHAKFVPAGMKPTFTREPMLKDEMDEWLARVICFAFSVPPTPFVRDSNRATAQTTRAAALTEGLSPLLRWVKRLMDEVIARHLGFAGLEFVWSDERDDDPAEQARINDTYVRAGIKSVDEVRTELGLAAVGFGNAIYTGQGAVPLKDVAKEQAAPDTAAKRARDDARAKYSPDQPRVPAGNSDGGQWTSDGSGDAVAHAGTVAANLHAGVSRSLSEQRAVGIMPAAAGDIDEYVPYDKLPSNAQFILQHRILAPDGTLSVGLPDGYIATPSKDGDGVVFRKPGTTGNANTIRVMPPDDRYPTGRVIIYNGSNQPISPYSGQTGTPAQYHYQFQGIDRKQDQ